MYSPYTRSLLNKLLQDAHEDKDEGMARTLEELVSDKVRWPEVRNFVLSDRKKWPDIAENASRSAFLKYSAPVERSVGSTVNWNEEEHERLEGEIFYRSLAEYHVPSYPDLELICPIHRPRFLKSKTSYEHVHGKRREVSLLSQVVNSDDEDAESSWTRKTRPRIVVVKRSKMGPGKTREEKKPGEEEGGEGEFVEGGPRKWKKADSMVKAGKRVEEDFEDVWRYESD